MATKDQIRLKRRKAFWAAANSPLAIILISGGAMAGIAKLYNDRQVEAADLETRRTAYVELLAEYQHRVSFLMDADAELNGYIGEGLKFTRGKQLSENGPDRRKWERVSEEVGQKEHNILRATGDYVPTTPVFARVDLLTLAARIERTGGIPDIQLGGLRLIRTLDTPPEVLWIFVRAHLPIMMQFGVTRHVMYTNGEIPLPRGTQLTKRQEKILGFPEVKPGDLERVSRENDRLHTKLQKTIGRLERNEVETER